MPEGGQSLGRATVEVRADLSQLPGDLDAAKAQVAGVGGGFKDLKASAKEFRAEVKASLSPLTDLRKTVHLIVGSFGYVAGAVAGVIALISALSGKTEEHRKRVREAWEEWVKADEVLKNYQKTLDNIVAPQDPISNQLDAIVKAKTDALEAVSKKYLSIINTNKGGDNKAVADLLEAETDRVRLSYQQAVNEAIIANTIKSKNRDKADAAARQKKDDEEANQKAQDLATTFRVLQEAQDAMNEHIEQQIKLQEELNKKRVQGLLDAQRETMRLFDMQSSGFGASDSTGSSKSFEQRLLNQLRSIGSQIGGA